MSNTNRTLNRLFLLIVGLALLALGLVVLASLVVPDQLLSGLETARVGVDLFWQQPSWQVLGVVAAGVLVILLAIFALRQGGGRTSTALRVETAVGVVSVEDRFVREALSSGLDGIGDIQVSIYRVRGVPVARLIVECVRGSEPQRVLRAAEEAARRLSCELGARVELFVEIVSYGKAQRLVEPQA